MKPESPSCILSFLKGVKQNSFILSHPSTLTLAQCKRAGSSKTGPFSSARRLRCMVTRPPGGWAPGSVHGTLTASQLATPVDGVRSFKASWLKTMLYLFSGATRKAPIAAFLQKLSSGTGIQFQVHEIDLAVLKTHRLKRREPRGPRANIVSLDIDIPDSVFLVAGTCPSLRGIRRSIPVV